MGVKRSATALAPPHLLPVKRCGSLSQAPDVSLLCTGSHEIFNTPHGANKMSAARWGTGGGVQVKRSQAAGHPPSVGTLK